MVELRSAEWVTCTRERGSVRAEQLCRLGCGHVAPAGRGGRLARRVSDVERVDSLRWCTWHFEQSLERLA